MKLKQGRFEQHEWEVIRDAVRKQYPNATTLLLKLNEIVAR